MRYNFTKRLLDIAVSFMALLAAAPLIVAVAICIVITSGRPILFLQNRPGLNGQPFTMVKFRTMRPFIQAKGWTTDATRMTRLGGLLRSTSIDELPTLWNVIRGEMSLVGPRPLLMKYLDLYTPAQARRMEVKPGLTGLAQINGRNAQTWHQRFEFDLEYIERRSMSLDAYILVRTAAKVLKREGISAEGQVTMPEFRGD